MASENEGKTAQASAPDVPTNVPTIGSLDVLPTTGALSEAEFERPIDWSRYRPFAPIYNSYRRGGQGWLYLVADSDPSCLKIGIAVDVDQRLLSFQLANRNIRLLAKRSIPKALDRQVEKMVHLALADCALGREWFRIEKAAALKVATPIIAKAWRTHRRLVVDGVIDGPMRVASY